MTGFLRSMIVVFVGVTVGVLLFALRPAVHAFPEYATRTGEPCATCHVNPAGCGSRTMRGSLWIAAGRPDKVPPLPGTPAKEAASAVPTDDLALYTRYACGGCHGATGEGGVGPALNKA